MVTAPAGGVGVVGVMAAPCVWEIKPRATSSTPSLVWNGVNTRYPTSSPAFWPRTSTSRPVRYWPLAETWRNSSVLPFAVLAAAGPRAWPI
jgi:hypothetical protein